MNSLRKVCCAAILATAVVAPAGASAYDAVSLSFNRTTGDASGVTVTVTDPATSTPLSGVSATLRSASHPFKTSGSAVTSAILCPDVNGNTGPEIKLVFEITGLPAEFNIASMGLDIHALNGSGSYQQNDDGKNRQWNLSAALGGKAFGTLDNIDIAKGVGSASAVHKSWSITPAAAVKATTSLEVTLTITKGTTNDGCFIGLGGLTLSSDGEVPDQPVTPPVGPEKPEGAIAPGIYHIVWKAATNSYITENSSTGAMTVGDYSPTAACFWEITPVSGKSDVYTIKSVATGRYVGSCNLTPSSASKIFTTATPVEYYIGRTAQTAAEIAGCYWFSSTDCAGHSDENASPRALNKDGASSSVITWQAGSGKVGSYWRLIKATEEYEVRPFSPAASIDKAVFYTIANPSGQAWNGSAWVAADASAAAQAWCFIGTGNAEGYQIVNRATRQPLGGGARYAVGNAGNGLYGFKAKEGGAELDLGGVKAFRFLPRRSDFALSAQIYSMPCGSLGSIWISKANIEGGISPLHYPLVVKSGRTPGQPAATRPTAGYTMFTRSRATLAAGSEATLTVALSAALPEGTTLTAYNDWNRDGVFDTAIPVTITGSEATTTIAVPAKAAEGSSRLRLRLTSNGLTGADDETAGQTLDLIINVVAETPAATLAVKSSDISRGTATTDGTTASARAKGTAKFVSWMEGHDLASLDADYTPELTRPMTLTAMFTPNMEDLFGGVEIVGKDDTLTVITLEGRTVTAPGARAIALVAVNGTVAARSTGSSLDASAVAPGIYIAVAVTPGGIATSKLSIR